VVLHDQAPVGTGIRGSDIKKQVDGLIRIGYARKLRPLLKDCIFYITFTKLLIFLHFM
jgi:hypothetical protein